MQNLGWIDRLGIGFKRSTIGTTQAGVVLWLLCLPLVMARFHVLSVVALGLNALLWLPMSLSVLLGFGVLFFGTICPPLGGLFGWLCGLNFRLLEGVIDAADRLPYGHFWLPGPSDWWLWGFYVVLGIFAAFPRLQPPRRWCFALLGAWVTIGLVPALRPHPHERLDCTYLNMGHGCAVLLELPSGKTVLYDAGELGLPKSASQTICECLWERGVSHLDAVVISHPDIDHYNALPKVLDRFSVGEVCVSPMMFEKNAHAVRVLRNAIEHHGVPIHEIWAGDRLKTGDASTIEVLHPPRHGVLGSENANSVVLSVRHLGRELLFLGDLERPGLQDLLAEEPHRADVLLAPHHGSRQSNSPGLAEWCSPRWVVFSGDGRWNIPEVEKPYQAMGGQVFHTYRLGAIHVQIDPNGLEMIPFVATNGLTP
jgi:competence protein ComEC